MNTDPNLKPAPPFSCSYTPHIPELLLQLRCTIAISTYQAGKVVFLSPKDEHSLVQLPRTFNKAMGMALEGDKMAVACKDEILVLGNSRELAAAYPKQSNTYDSMFMPRAAYYTGVVDIHDLEFGHDGLYAVNTSFSCIAKIDDNYSFTPVWKPPFITRLASEDRCHLNGMAMVNGRPKYVTAFNTGDTPQSWRDTVTQTGILMDVDTNEIILEGLPMPHSPRMFNGKLYLLLSATGELIRISPERKSYEVVAKCNGFVRGLAYHGDYLFIGLSKLRQNSSTFAKLDFAKNARTSGIIIIHEPTGAIVGEIQYKASVDEIYDVQIIPNSIRPNILNTVREDYKMGLSIPGSTFWSAGEPTQ